MSPSVNPCFLYVDTSVKLRILVNFREEIVQFVPAEPRVEEPTVTQDQQGDKQGKSGGLSGIMARFKKNNAHRGIITGEKRPYEPC